MHMFMTNLNKAYERASLQYKQRAVHREDKNERLSKIKLHRQFNPMNLYVEKLPQQTKVGQNCAEIKQHNGCIMLQSYINIHTTHMKQGSSNSNPTEAQFHSDLYLPYI